MFKLTRVFVVVLVLSSMMTTAGCDILFGPSSGSTPAQLEREIFKLVNDYRRSQGLGDLVWNDTIAEAAREHSRDMAAGTVPFGHEGSNERWSLIGQVLPWQSIAEVVARSGSARTPSMPGSRALTTKRIWWGITCFPASVWPSPTRAGRFTPPRSSSSRCRNRGTVYVIPYFRPRARGQFGGQSSRITNDHMVIGAPY